MRKTFVWTSEKNRMSTTGGRFEIWLWKEEKYQKVFQVNIEAALELIINFVFQKTKKMLIFCFPSKWESRLRLGFKITVLHLVSSLFADFCFSF